MRYLRAILGTVVPVLFVGCGNIFTPENLIAPPFDPVTGRSPGQMVQEGVAAAAAAHDSFFAPITITETEPLFTPIEVFQQEALIGVIEPLRDTLFFFYDRLLQQAGFPAPEQGDFFPIIIPGVGGQPASTGSDPGT